jgi:two-component system sensor histidine kinase UhpB
MEELLALARQLRPTALDDHGLVAALAGQVSDFGRRAGMQAHFHHHGDVPILSDEEQLVIFRVTQEEPVERRQALAARGASTWSSRSSGARCCASATTATASTRRPAPQPTPRRGRRSPRLSGMRSARCSSAGTLDVFTGPARAPPSS